MKKEILSYVMLQDFC